MKRALITGITGQDGAYLAQLLLDKGYEVHGIKRRSSLFNTARIDHFFQDPHANNLRFHLHFGDLTDSSNLIRIIQKVQPDEIYNMGAQSHVKVSFDTPEYTSNSDALGTLRLLEAIRILHLEKKVKFYQASSSEMYGKVQESPQTEKTSFYPRSPYGVAKLYAHWITINYRESYGMFASNGILFNHESPLRGETFVTRKITRAASRIKFGLQDKTYLGNLDAKRDWGHAADYVEAVWRILQNDTPDDFVIATGKSYSVRDFANLAFSIAGFQLEWIGKGVDEKGVCKESRAVLVEVDPRYFRPSEVESLLGDASKAKQKLGWKPKHSFQTLVEDMMKSDLLEAEKQAALKSQGYTVIEPHQ